VLQEFHLVESTIYDTGCCEKRNGSWALKGVDCQLISGYNILLVIRYFKVSGFWIA